MLLGALFAALTPLSAPSPAPADPADSGDAAGRESTYQLPLDSARLTQDLLGNDVVVLPGSIARFDRAWVDALTANGALAKDGRKAPARAGRWADSGLTTLRDVGES